MVLLALAFLALEAPASPTAPASLSLGAVVDSQGAAFDGGPTPSGSSSRFATYVTPIVGGGRDDSGIPTRAVGIIGRLPVPGTGSRFGTLGMQFGAVFSKNELQAGRDVSFMRFQGVHSLEYIGADYQTPALGGRVAAEVGVRMALKYAVETVPDTEDQTRHTYGAGPVAFAAAHVALSRTVGLRVEAARLTGSRPLFNDKSLRFGITIAPGRRR